MVAQPDSAGVAGTLNIMNDPSPPIIELFGPEVRHCTEPFASTPATAFHRPDTLPYGDLKGPGLERLWSSIFLWDDMIPHRSEARDPSNR